MCTREFMNGIPAVIRYILHARNLFYKLSNLFGQIQIFVSGEWKYLAVLVQDNICWLTISERFTPIRCRHPRVSSYKTQSSTENLDFTRFKIRCKKTFISDPLGFIIKNSAFPEPNIEVIFDQEKRPIFTSHNNFGHGVGHCRIENENRNLCLCVEQQS